MLKKLPLLVFLFFTAALYGQDRLNYNPGIKKFSMGCERLADEPGKREVSKWNYPGGDMGSSEMYFYDNGLMVLDSSIFSAKKDKYYFLYFFGKDKKHLTLIHCDKRINFADFVDVNRSYQNTAVSDINVNEKSVTYITGKENGIFFYGWLFSPGKPGK